MNANDEGSLQLNFIYYLRKAMPNKIITYTFPGDGEPYNQGLNFPFRDVVR